MMAKLKWAKLKNKLPKFEHEPSFKQCVDAAKRQILGVADDQDPEMEVANASLSAMGRRLAEFKLEKYKLEDMLSDINAKIAAMDEIIPKLMEENGQESFKITGGVGFCLKSDVQPKLEDEELFMSSLSEEEQQALRSIQPQRFKSHVKAILEDGLPLPPGTSATYRTTVSVLEIKNFVP